MLEHINYTFCYKIVYTKSNCKLGLLSFFNSACACSKCVINGFSNPNGVIVYCSTNC
jgi:hypothetical protein